MNSPYAFAEGFKQRLAPAARCVGRRFLVGLLIGFGEEAAGADALATTGCAGPPDRLTAQIPLVAQLALHDWNSTPCPPGNAAGRSEISESDFQRRDGVPPVAGTRISPAAPRSG